MDDEPMIDKIIDLASRRPSEESAWFGRLQKSKDGAPLPTIANALTIFGNDPVLSGIVAFNEFRDDYVLVRAAPPARSNDAPLPGPYPRPWAPADETLIQAYLQQVYMPRFTAQSTQQSMVAAAALNRFHPVRQYLGTLVWDGVKRLDNWLINAFDCDQTAFVRAAGAKIMIAAVRRVMQPGVKFDYMLVLEGLQGLGKSRGVRALCPDRSWFSDAIPADLTNKDAALSLSGVWILEFAEIEHLIRAEVETIKAFLSRQTDRFRPPYGRIFVERPRQCVFIGTTNSDDYLRDASGNRRIWPAKTRAADIHWIELNRDQLWAEAVSRERGGEVIWLDDEPIQVEAAKEQLDRMAEDVWQHKVKAWVQDMPWVRIDQVLEHGLAVPTERMSKPHEMRVGKILRSLGWEKKVRRIDGANAKVWMPPSATAGEG